MQACGDAHLSNFGVFGSPERRLIFDVNDFDETLPAPWEWDVKRLAASLVVAGRENGSPEAARRGRPRDGRRVPDGDAAVRDDAELAVWYAHLDVEAEIAKVRAHSRQSG